MLALPYGGLFEHPTYMPFATGHDDDPAKIRAGIGGRLKSLLLRSMRPEDQRAKAWRWLAQIIRTWRPNIVHTFGLRSGSEFLGPVVDMIGAEALGRWVIQLRGGSDLAFSHADPVDGPRLAALVARADAIVTDNLLNFRYLEDLGVRVPEGRTLIVPGTGGVDIDQLASQWAIKPSERRLILWPKAYESPWSKAVPVLEALRIAWDRLGGCRIHVLAADDEVRQSIRLLPQGMIDAITVHSRIPRDEVIAMMREARVMLAPSLIDGTPNTMWEAMACGAVPIVSPLPTITPIVEADRNVLFARNLYPEEIRAQLVRAMSDDDLVERISDENLSVVRRLADRAVVRPRLLAFYRSLL